MPDNPFRAEKRRTEGAPDNPFRSEFDQPQPKLTGEPGKEFLTGMGLVAPELLGFAVDLANLPFQLAESITGLDVSSEEPIGGSRAIQRGLSDIGLLPAPGEEPEGFARRAGQGIATGLLGGVSVGAAGLSLVRTGAPKVTSTARKIMEDLGKSMAQNPARVLSAEAGLGLTAAVTGEAAVQEFGDLPGVRALGQLAGGFAPFVVTSTLKGTVRLGVTVAGKLPVTSLLVNAAKSLRGLGPSQAFPRASVRLRRAAGDPDQALIEARTAPVLRAAPLTQIQRSGNQGLLRLERSVFEESDALLQQADERIVQVNKIIRESLEGLGTEPIERTREVFEAQRAYLLLLMEARTAKAAENAGRRLVPLTPKQARQKVNVIARDEINKAFKDIDAQDKELWLKVDQDAQVSFAGSMEALDAHMAAMGKAQRKDIPNVAKTLLNPKSGQFLGQVKSVKVPDASGFRMVSERRLVSTVTTVRELRSLSSKLRQEARNARATGPQQNLNKARIANDLADAITEDFIEAAAVSGGDFAGDIETAVAFTRRKKELFNRDEVGKILGRDQFGADRIRPELTLETSLTGKSPVAREKFTEMMAAIKASEKTDPGVMLGAVEDWVKHEFMKSAVRNGVVSPELGQTFLRNNAEFLNEFPLIKRDIEIAVLSQETALIRERRMNSMGARLNNPQISRAAMFIEEDPVVAFNKIIASRKPGIEIQKIINKANRDPTGKALEGLRSGFAELMIRRGMIKSSEDISGQRVISGVGLKDFLAIPQVRAVATRLYTENQMKRIDRIAETAIRLGKMRHAKKSKEGIISDAPGKIADAIATVSGAGLFRNLARLFGVGGTVQIPGKGAVLARDMLQGHFADPARRLLTDAIVSDDPELFAALMRGMQGAETQKDVRRVYAWILGVAHEYGENVSQMMAEKPPPEAPAPRAREARPQ